jgi:hypothetical protein
MGDRLSKIYKPILYPIYMKFMKAILVSHKFWVKPPFIENKRKDLYYLQSLGSDQNKINDIVDAIELKIPSLDIIKSVWDHYYLIYSTYTADTTIIKTDNTLNNNTNIIHVN